MAEAPKPNSASFEMANQKASGLSLPPYIAPANGQFPFRILKLSWSLPQSGWHPRPIFHPANLSLFTLATGEYDSASALGRATRCRSAQFSPKPEHPLWQEPEQIKDLFLITKRRKNFSPGQY